MKHLTTLALLSCLLLTTSAANGQAIELGANIGGNFPTGTQAWALRKGRLGAIGSLSGQVRLGHFRLGVFAETATLNFTGVTTESTYDPATGRVWETDRNVRVSQARPYYAGGLSCSIAGRSFYSGIMAGYGVRQTENEYYNYDPVTKKSTLEVFRGASHSMLLAGVHFGYTRFIKKIGINAETGIRYAVLSPGSSFGPAYNTLYFPFTIGVRYKI